MSVWLATEPCHLYLATRCFPSVMRCVGKSTAPVVDDWTTCHNKKKQKNRRNNDYDVCRVTNSTAERFLGLPYRLIVHRTYTWLVCVRHLLIAMWCCHPVAHIGASALSFTESKYASPALFTHHHILHSQQTTVEPSFILEWFRSRRFASIQSIRNRTTTTWTCWHQHPPGGPDRPVHRRLRENSGNLLDDAVIKHQLANKISVRDSITLVLFITGSGSLFIVSLLLLITIC